MTWEEKLMMLRTLTPTEVTMRKPGDWYVAAMGREVKRGHFLEGRHGEGKTPEEAVEDDWNLMTNLDVREGIVVCGRGYFWSGSRFSRLREE